MGIVMTKLCALVITLLCIAGCSFTFPHNSLLQKPGTIAKPIDKNLCKDHNGALSAKTTVIKETISYRVEKFTFVFRNTKSVKNNTVEGEYWRQINTKNSRALAVLIPGTGDRVSTEGSPELLVDAGFDVLRFFVGINIFDKKALIEKTALTENELRTFARSGKNVIRLRVCDFIFVVNYFNVPRHKAIGISGVSLGGIDTPILGGMMESMRSQLVMISGGNIANILRTSSEKNIVEIRNLVRERFVGSEKRLWQILGEELWEIDPLRFAPALDPSKTRVITNYWDTVIRYEFARELWRASSKPDFEIIIFPPGHYGSVLLLWIPMVRYEFKCLIWPVCIPIPWSIARVQEINKQFFKETLPQ